MRIQADQLCVDYNGTVALYDASLCLLYTSPSPRDS